MLHIKLCEASSKSTNTQRKKLILSLYKLGYDYAKPESALQTQYDKHVPDFAIQQNITNWVKPLFA